jgi:hypothetical protein
VATHGFEWFLEVMCDLCGNPEHADVLADCFYRSASDRKALSTPCQVCIWGSFPVNRSCQFRRVNRIMTDLATIAADDRMGGPWASCRPESEAASQSEQSPFFCKVTPLRSLYAPSPGSLPRQRVALPRACRSEYWHQRAFFGTDLLVSCSQMHVMPVCSNSLESFANHCELRLG